MQRIAEKIKNTRGRILVCGKSTSAYIGNILAGYLIRLHLPAFFVDDCETFARACNENDTVIAVSYSGRTVEIVHTVQQARERGASTICITAFEKSALAKACNEVLPFTATESKNGQFPIVARLAQLAVCDALCSKICILKE